MNFNRIRKRKKPNYVKSIIYILLLLIVIYLWLNAEGIIERFFGRVE